ncbi:MAG TPA: hypothetical protein ENK18_17810 [Deltaproteobacteria bacterium]|nr:hypothetical protein [Deltaproteobacteria bacterium]
MEQRSEARDFILGFAVGFTGSFLALLLGLLHRDYLPGILCGFIASLLIGVVAGTAVLMLPDLFGILDVAASGGELQQINLDGSLVGSGPSLALMAAIVVGLGLGALGTLGAAIVALGGGGAEQGA